IGIDLSALGRRRRAHLHSSIGRPAAIISPPAIAAPLLAVAVLLTAATSRALGRFVCGHSRRLLRVAIRLLPPVLGRALAACMMAAVTAAIRPLSVVPAAGTPDVLERHLVLLLRLGLGLIR